jgi:hypothetical protein
MTNDESGRSNDEVRLTSHTGRRLFSIICPLTTVIGPLENECIRNALIGI